MKEEEHNELLMCLFLCFCTECGQDEINACVQKCKDDGLQVPQFGTECTGCVCFNPCDVSVQEYSINVIYHVKGQ